jgi:hypothetical protein
MNFLKSQLKKERKQKREVFSKIKQEIMEHENRKKHENWLNKWDYFRE